MRRLVPRRVRRGFLPALLAAGPAVLLPDVPGELAAASTDHFPEPARVRVVVCRLVQRPGAEPARCRALRLVRPRLGRDDVWLCGVFGDCPGVIC